jgi:hypothetical protein
MGEKIEENTYIYSMVLDLIIRCLCDGCRTDVSEAQASRTLEESDADEYIRSATSLTYHVVFGT